MKAKLVCTNVAEFVCRTEGSEMQQGRKRKTGGVRMEHMERSAFLQVRDSSRLELECINVELLFRFVELER